MSRVSEVVAKRVLYEVAAEWWARNVVWKNRNSDHEKDQKEFEKKLVTILFRDEITAIYFDTDLNDMCLKSSAAPLYKAATEAGILDEIEPQMSFKKPQTRMEIREDGVWIERYDQWEEIYHLYK